MNNSSPGNWQAQNTKNTTKLGFWTLAWLAGTALLTFGPKLVWDYSTLPTIAAVIVNLALGFSMIMAIARYLKGLDELGRKVFLDAAAITLGVALVGGSCYEILEDVRLITYQPEISHLIELMAVTFMISTFVANWRYR